MSKSILTLALVAVLAAGAVAQDISCGFKTEGKNATVTCKGKTVTVTIDGTTLKADQVVCNGDSYSIRGKDGHEIAVFTRLARGGSIVVNPPRPRVRLGVKVAEPAPAVCEQLEVDRSRCLILEDVTEESAGEKAGLKRYDVITRIDGSDVATEKTLRLRLAEKKPGEKLKLDLIRCGKPKNVVVTLEPDIDVTGRVLDLAGNAVAGATITLLPSATLDMTRNMVTGKTDEDGNFAIVYNTPKLLTNRITWAKNEPVILNRELTLDGTTAAPRRYDVLLDGTNSTKKERSLDERLDALEKALKRLEKLLEKMER